MEEPARLSARQAIRFNMNIPAEIQGEGSVGQVDVTRLARLSFGEDIPFITIANHLFANGQRGEIPNYWGLVLLYKDGRRELAARDKGLSLAQCGKIRKFLWVEAHVADALRTQRASKNFQVPSENRVETSSRPSGTSFVSSDRNASKSSRAFSIMPGHCPYGHGRMKPWEGKLRCFTCGWPDITRRNSDITMSDLPICPHCSVVLKPWESKLRCWSCGYPENKQRRK